MAEDTHENDEARDGGNPLRREVIVAAAIAILAAAAISGIEYLPSVDRAFERIKSSRVEEWVVLLAALLAGSVWFSWRRWKDTQRHLAIRRKAEAASRLSDERFQAAFENAIVGMAISTPDMKLQAVNAAYERMLGYAFDELRSMSVLDITHPADRWLTRRIFDDVLRGVRNRFELEKRYLTKDGETVWALVGGKIIYDSTDSPAYLVTHIVDITERKQAETREREWREELARANRINMLGECAATLAHEVNQPLSIIANLAQACVRDLKMQGTADETLITDLSEIVDQALSAGEIIANMRQLVANGRRPAAPFELNNAIEEAVGLLSRDLEHRNIEIDMDLHGDACTVYGQRTEIQQVILNLVRNAADALEEQAPEERRPIVVASRLLSESEAEVAVSDRGPGLPPDVKRRVFESEIISDKAHGFGMGLRICRRIIEQNAGRIWLDEEHVPGVCIRFTLSLWRGDDGAEERHQTRWR